MTSDRPLLLAALLLTAGLIRPAPAGAEAGWTDYGYVQEFRPTTAGRFLFRLPVKENPSGCSEKEWFFRDHTGPGAEHIFRILLRSVEDNLPVRVHVTGTCDHNGYSAVNAAAVAP
ncbi:hypothetical protein [Thiohalorhabdus methylotrophus]|uniref:Protease inhibitor Inh n=1 Tax=Thiohalorhabdus methylotrophus TaxID=3242694 RepID=A0ABV4TRJ5_9GAMM